MQFQYFLIPPWNGYFIFPTLKKFILSNGEEQYIIQIYDNSYVYELIIELLKKYRKKHQIK